MFLWFHSLHQTHIGFLSEFSSANHYILTEPHPCMHKASLSLTLPDQIQFVVPGIDVEDWPNSDHVVVTVAHVLDVLVLQGHLA